MTRKKVAVGVIVPDTSPLMTLGRIKRLDVLSYFTVGITIVDVVLEEALRPANDVNGAVRQWWDQRPNNVMKEETLIGAGLKAKRELGEDPPTRNLGEIAVDEYATRLAKTGSPNDIPLVLFEDPDVLELRVAKLKNVHLMNTAGLLVGLQQLGIMKDAMSVLREINGQRKTPMLPIDRPARTSHHQSSIAKAVKGWE